MHSMMHVLPGQGDYYPAKNEFHGGEQVPVQGIIILMPETNLLKNQRISPPVKLLKDQAIDDENERYIWEKRENVCYDIRRENRG